MFFSLCHLPPSSTLFPYTTLFRSDGVTKGFAKALEIQGVGYKAEPKPFGVQLIVGFSHPVPYHAPQGIKISVDNNVLLRIEGVDRSEEHTSVQSHSDLVCRLLLEKKKKKSQH